MSDVALRQLLRQLSKDKAEFEWQLRDCEWRLDQEAAAAAQAEQRKKAILTELGEVSQLLEQEDNSYMLKMKGYQPHRNRKL